MPEFKRTAQAEWKGDLRGGEGHFSADSGIFTDVPYRYVTRFENEPGSNPEELLAAAHSACYSMAFSNFLAKNGHTPESIVTRATCVLYTGEGGTRIGKMILDVKGRVPGLDEAKFKEYAVEAEKGCPVSNLLRCGLEIEVNATLA